MLKRSLVLFGVSFLVGSTSAADEKPARDISSANKALGRGINLGNALDAPNEGAWGVVLKAEYFKTIKDAGFQSVRLPVNWANHADADAPYTIDDRFAQRVDWAIDQALDNKLNIIVNIHHYDDMFTDPDKHLPRLIGLWNQIAKRYKNRPASVYFEMLNEPHDKLTAEKWNAIIPKVLAVMRKTNPTRPVLIGPVEWNAVRALPSLELPRDDRNIILTIHCYDPFEFTHQGASWVKGSDRWKGRKWTGTEAEKKALRNTFDTAAKWAKDHDRPVNLGEFGAYQEADMESRVRWTRFMVQEALRCGFSFAYWEFCSGFGAYDPERNTWRAGLKAALVE
jgi:endoglucanase